MPTRYRFPLVAMGMLALLSALGTALVRLGWEVPLPNYDMLIAHGSLTVCGFLGTLISLERAVALNRPWAYLAPLLTGAGGLAQALAPASPLGPWLVVLGSLGLALLFAVILPAVLNIPVPFRPAFYLPLALLHATLALRVASDLLGWTPGRAWGGLLNVLALLSFLANTGYAILKGR